MTWLKRWSASAKHILRIPLGNLIYQQSQRAPNIKKVWACIQGIPAGETKTYGEVAKKIKSGARAVGSACGANPYPLIAPCHRVVSAQGIGGFMKENEPGLYRQIKLWLLRHEGAL